MWGLESQVLETLTTPPQTCAVLSPGLAGPAGRKEVWRVGDSHCYDCRPSSSPSRPWLPLGTQPVWKVWGDGCWGDGDAYFLGRSGLRSSGESSLLPDLQDLHGHSCSRLGVNAASSTVLTACPHGAGDTRVRVSASASVRCPPPSARPGRTHRRGPTGAQFI